METALIDARNERAAQCAEDFSAVLAATEPAIPAVGQLAGLVWLGVERAAEQLGHQPYLGADNLHFPMNVAALLEHGFVGIAQLAAQRTAACEGERAGYLRAIARCHDAAVRFVAAHVEEARAQARQTTGAECERLLGIAETCVALTERAPRHFREAVQLFWFAWCLRGRGTVGRLDQHLYPFYAADLAAGEITHNDALMLLCELWEGFNRGGNGDTLINVMLGGQDRQGNDATNALSLLMLDAALAVHNTEPHLNARLHAGTPEAFIDKLVAVQLLGHGQGTVFNDELIIPALVDAGVPLESARNYANDGCAEVVIDGESGIELAMMEDMKVLELTLFNGEENPAPETPQGYYWTRYADARPVSTGLELGYRTGDFTVMTSFAEFYAAFREQYRYQLELKLHAFSHELCTHAAQNVTSPFLAGTFPICLRTGIDPLRGGLPIPCNVVFLGGLPTLADGLAAIKQVVFTERVCTPLELLDALRADFVGYDALRRRLLAAPKFGNDSDEVDAIAAELVRDFCAIVRAFPTPSGKPFWPALFNHLFNDYAKIAGATPDGRRRHDPIAEHYSPTPGRATQGPTAVIRSACKAPLADACGTADVHLSLPRGLAPQNEEGRAVVMSLLKAALRQGIVVLNIAIYDVEAMRAARQAPERYTDLIVRVWGFSARFIDLSDDMQDHIIARTIAEC